MYGNGRFVECRVVALSQDQTIAEVSLRASRINGDIDEDPTPAVGHVQQGYVIQTNKNGCFVRLSRTCEGRATLKNLCDGFLPHPDISFPMGRLVAGKVTNIRPVTKKGNHIKDSINMQVDLDMRESTLLDEQQNRLTFENIQVGEKYSGSVQRIEDYGVFVQLQNSSVTGLVHLSECSDGFVKNLSSMFDPGDLVKVLVLKKDEGTKQLGFSMKASHFEDDEDSDDSSVDSNIIDAFDETSDVEMKLTQADANSNNDSDDVASDDEEFVTKLASKAGLDSQSDENDSSERDDEDEDDGNSSDTSDDEHQNRLDTADRNSATALDTNVGFIWGAQGGSSGKSKQKDSKSEGDSSSDSSDESYSDSDEEEGSDGEGTGDKKKSKSSRKRQAERRRLEQETYHREMSLADGSADANPETADDFERLLAGSPNDSELWIRYMSFHLSLADIVAARVVANKALERIEFRQEREKLNVWTALLTLEHKYGNESTFQAALDRACSQNNPKHVYLRACEILEKDLQQSSFEASSVQIADKLFLTMCHKHKSKKKTWLAYMQYLLRQSRHQEAQNTMKRALKSLPSYKHTEVMSRFAQMEYELGSPSRARTLFDGLIEKFPKRLDLFFVYVDKECKYGTVENARKLLEAKVHERKLKDNKMKSLFKKWYRIEEEHGTDDSREHVKSSARSYVEGGST
jgi:rRNA biogenesis protein RRP5